MIINKEMILRKVAYFMPDVLVSVYFFFVARNYKSLGDLWVYYILGGAFVLLLIRAFMLVGSRYSYIQRVKKVRDLLSDFKKGKFIIQEKELNGNDHLTGIYEDLVIVGKHLDNIVSTQKNEIDAFHEFYNSLICSINSYFIVLDDTEKVVFANDGFSKKFQFVQADLEGKNIEDIFYFVNARLKGGVSQAKTQEKSVVLEKIHLLSVNKISIIADIKISNIIVQGRRQVVLIIDDVTSKLRKDYQISLMSQISKSIKRDIEIERLLYTILTGVTSGSGLGFNRAMLFLNENDEFLAGKMAVGPDSFDEAIEIWRSAPSFKAFVDDDVGRDGSGEVLLETVLSTKFPLGCNNIFIQSLIRKENIHIYDSNNDENIDDDIRHLMDVKEFVIVPIIAVNKAIGIIIADNKFNQVAIGNESIELLAIFASQAALSIESYNNLVSVKKEMRRLAERQNAIVESEKMAAVGRIAAHIAHEIRNPLVTMGGYSRRIIQLSKGTTMNNPGVNKSASIILKESERLEKILSNVMDFTKPTKYIEEFNNINDIIKDTVDLLKNLLLERKINVETDFNKNIPLVKSDFNQMKQVMLNLLQNSIDVTPPGGAIEISTENDETGVRIRVKDTGTGIDEADPKIIFEPFFTKKVTGVGLGLANVKRIIKDHNGSIDVKNREKAGVEFCINLPFPK
ncbi:MAG: GAF domain-containing protein [bacterium]|nr:GAF domain-containing protein [bacterium]